MTENTAILHDQLYTYGGAERVAVEIAREFDAPIYVVNGEHDILPPDIEVREIGSRLGKKLMGVHYQLEDIYQMLRWQHVNELYEFDTLIQTKTNPYWFVPKDDQTIVRYNHSTPRNLYDQHHRRGGSTIKDGMKIIQRMLYAQVLPYADAWVANSDVVQQRMRKYWDIDADVIYPPVGTDAADPDREDTQDYYLHVGRLDINKRIPLLREIAERVDVPVYVAGDGNERDALHPLPKNVRELGYVSEAEKWDLYAGAKATLFLAENEDFGIVPIESLASGTPVIAPAEGFTQYQITNGANGYLTPADPTVQDVTVAMDTLAERGVSQSPADMAAWAEQFNPTRFGREFRQVVEQAREQTAIKTQL